MSSIINNNNTSSSSSLSCASDFYDRHALYAPADILNVIKAEDEEQQRRINDAEGENTKRVLANNLAVMFGDNVRATWFQRGSSFVLSLLGGVRTIVAQKASDISASVSNKAGDLGHKAALNVTHTAEEVGNKAQEALFSASNALSNKAGEVGLQAQEKAHLLSDTLANKAEEVGLQAQEKAHDLSSSVTSQAHTAALNLKEKGIETAHNVSSLAQEKASDLKIKGVETVQGAKSLLSGKVQEYTHWLKGAVLNLSLYKKLGSLTGHSNMTFAMFEEETERAYRMNSSNEIHAIQNAQRIASLIKQLHPALYRPSSEPYPHYSTRLLEEGERARRVADAQNDKAALDNARTISGLINQKFSVPVEQLHFKKEIKADLLEEIKQRPFAAAM